MEIKIQHILDWEESPEELANYLASILNGDFSVEDAREEILAYHDLV